MAIVHNIRIYRAVLDCDGENGYKLTLGWNLEQSPGQPYTGDIFLLWFEDGECQITKKVKLTEGCATRGTVVGLIRKPATEVSVKLCCSENPDEAKSFVAVNVPQHSYDQMKAVYDGHTVEVTWSPLPDTSGSGQLTLNSSDKTWPLETKITPGAKSVVLGPSFNKPNGDAVWTVSARPCLHGAGWVSLGVSSPGVDIYAGVAVIKSVDVDVDQSSLTVKYTLPESIKESIETARVFFSIRGGANEYYKTTAYPPTPQGTEGIYTQQFLLPNDSRFLLQRLSQLELSISHGGPDSESTGLGSENSISLESPTIVPSIDADGKAGLRWACSGPEDGFEVVVNDLAPENSNEYEKKYDLQQVMDQTVRVAALHGPLQARGPYSRAVPFLQPGFYADFSDPNKPGLLRYMRRASGISTIALHGKLFEEDSSASLEDGPFNVEKVGTGYELNIDFTKDFTLEKLNDLIAKLFVSKIIPVAYYRLRNLITRLCPLEGKLVLPYYCAAERNGMRLDLRPGFLLKIETAHYVKQGNQVSSDNNGFVRGATSEYSVTLATNAQNNTALEMDSLFEYICGVWGATGVTNNYPYPVSGLMDFFSSPLRSAYYRLRYPTAFCDNSTPEELNFSKNICLVAIRPDEKMPNELNNRAVPCLLLRGRTSVTVHIQVMVNNTPVYVALGTTLGSLLQRYAANPDSVKMYRRTGLEKNGQTDCLPVYLGEAAREKVFTDALVLLSGDKIEV